MGILPSLSTFGLYKHPRPGCAWVPPLPLYLLGLSFRKLRGITRMLPPPVRIARLHLLRCLCCALSFSSFHEPGWPGEFSTFRSLQRKPPRRCGCPPFHCDCISCGAFVCTLHFSSSHEPGSPGEFSTFLPFSASLLDVAVVHLFPARSREPAPGPARCGLYAIRMRPPPKRSAIASPAVPLLHPALSFLS